MTEHGRVSLSLMRSRNRLENRRRTSPWILVVALAMFLTSIGLTVTVGFLLESRISAIEKSLGLAEE